MPHFRLSTSFRAQSGCISLLPSSISVGMQTAFLEGFTAVGHDGIMIAVVLLGLLKMRAFQHWTQSHQLHAPCHLQRKLMITLSCMLALPPMEGSRSAESGSQHREGIFLKGGGHEYLPEGVGGSMRQCGSERGLEASTTPASHQPLGDASSIFSSEAFLSGSDRPACSDQDGQHNSGFVYKHGGDTCSPGEDLL